MNDGWQKIEEEIAFLRKRRHRVNMLKEGRGISQKQARRLLIIEEYGGKCLLCQENRIYVLDLHHVHGGGTEHVKQLGGGHEFQNWIIDNDFPDEIVVLCANCHRMVHYLDRTQCEEQ